MSVAQLQGAAQEIATLERSRDLNSILKDVQKHENWKTAPKLSTLLRFAPWYRIWFGLAPNTVLSHAKLTSALLAEHNKDRLFYTSTTSNETMASTISMTIRTLASKWRRVKQDPAVRKTILDKVDSIE